MPAGVAVKYAVAQETTTTHHHYKLFDVGTFGGNQSLFSNPGSVALNKRGMATGMANTPLPDPFSPNNCFFDCWVDHAFVWKDGITTDLGTLPGGPSSFPVAINNLVLSLVQSHTAPLPPLPATPALPPLLLHLRHTTHLTTL